MSRKSSINVTPLVDIILVLLITFMVAMPVLMRHITIEVPRQLDETTEVSVTQQITVIGKADGSVVISDGAGDTTVTRIDLAKTLRPLLEQRKTEKIVFVDFDDALAYADAVSIMDTIKGLGEVREEGGKQVREEIKVALKIREEVPAGLVPAPQ
jgi:biopolymer transport protein ExbD